MTRNEFLERLRKGLSSLPQAEQEEALRYYEEYFDDAGPENEAKVMEELGSPEDLARNIIANSTFSLAQPAAQQQRSAGGEKGGFRQMGTPSGGKSAGGNASGDRALLWVLVILSSVVWLPLLLGAAGTVLGLMFAAVMTALGLIAAAIGMIVGFFAALIVGVPLLATSFWDGLVVIGMAFQCLGGLLLFGALAALFFRFLLPWGWKQCLRFFRFMRRKCRELIRGKGDVQ